MYEESSHEAQNLYAQNLVTPVEPQQVKSEPTQQADTSVRTSEKRDSQMGGKGLIWDCRDELKECLK